MKKTISIILSMLLLISGCQNVPEEQDNRIGVIVESLTNENTVIMVDIFEEYGEEQGYEVLTTDGEADAGKIISAAENYATMGIEMLLFGSMGLEDAKSAIDAAKNINPDVIGVISAMEVEEMDFVVSQSDFNAAKEVGKAAGAWINENLVDNIQIGLINMQGTENTPLGMRYDGFIEGVNETVNNPVEYVDGILDLNAGRTGYEIMEDWLQGFPDIKVVFGTADFVSLGAYEAIKASNVNPEEYAIYGVDGTTNAIQMLQENSSFRGTVDSGSSAVPKAMIDVATKLREGVSPENIYVEIPPLVIDSSNAENWEYDYSNVIFEVSE